MLAEKGMFMQQEKRSIGALKQAWDRNLGVHFHSAYNVVNLQCKITTYWQASQGIFYGIFYFGRLPPRRHMKHKTPPDISLPAFSTQPGYGGLIAAEFPTQGGHMLQERGSESILE
jgi:hypothetical protein